jgi:peptidyl-prolyl cis-trans isomerase B (cyclophilin B)
MLKTLILLACCLVAPVVSASGQAKPTGAEVKPTPKSLKKTNPRPVARTSKAEPFDKATVAEMATRCVKLETEAGDIELEMFPESAPETVRNFLNLTASGAYDTTTFSRVVPNFVIQGGNLSTREKSTPELVKRSQRTIPDEPSQIKHERGILSMARPDTPNSATTHFFILVGKAEPLDGTFAAFGRVTKGMEIVDAINKMPVEAEKPLKPVRLKRASVAPCPAQTNPK